MIERIARLRIRSVRMKNGGASVRVLHQAEHSDAHHKFVARAAEIADARPRMAGYAMIAWTQDGATSVDCQTYGPPIPIMLLPEFVKTCVADWVYSMTDIDDPVKPDSA